MVGLPGDGGQKCGCSVSPTAAGWDCAGVNGEGEHQEGFGWHQAMLMTFLPVPLLLHRGQLGNQSLLPSLRLRSRLLVSPPPLPPERLLTAHTAPMGAEHPLLPARIRPTGWKPLQGALRRSPTVLCCPRAPHPSPPPDFRAQRQLTEGAHSRDQDVPQWGRDPRPCITPMWGNTPHPCLSFPPSTATHRAQCCFGLQERHRCHPQSRTRAWLWGEPAMGGDWHPGGGSSIAALPPRTRC